MTEETEEIPQAPIEYGRFINIAETKIIDEYVRRGYYITDKHTFGAEPTSVTYVQLLRDNEWKVGKDRRVKEDLKENE